jgi:hypothetical protein
MSIGASIFAFVLSLAGSLIAARIYETYAKKRDNGEFKAETTALQLLEFAIAILPKEDRTKFYEQWFTDLVFLDTSGQRLRFACGLPQAAVILRTKSLVSIPFVVITKRGNKNVVADLTILILFPIILLPLAIVLFYSPLESFADKLGMRPTGEFTWCINQDGHRVTCDTTHRPDLKSHPW